MTGVAILVQATQKNDLTVQPVGLDVAGPAGKALPRGATGEVVTADRSQGTEGCTTLGVQVRICNLDPGRCETPRALLLSKPPQLFRRRVLRSCATSRLQRVCQVGKQFQVLASHYLRVGVRVEAALVQVCSHLFAHVVDAFGVPPDIEEPCERRGRDLDHTWFEMGRGHEHAHRLHVGEASQRQTFVLHPVLRTDHRSARRCASSELDEERLAVLGLGGEDGHVAVSEAGRRRALEP